SFRSRMPPKPGSHRPASFCPASRFAADSRRSPQMDPMATIGTRATVKATPKPVVRTGANSASPIAAPTTLPTAPARVFVGDRRGARGVRPNRRPMTKAATSETATATARATKVAAPSSPRSSVRAMPWASLPGWRPRRTAAAAAPANRPTRAAIARTTTVYGNGLMAAAGSRQPPDRGSDSLDDRQGGPGEQQRAERAPCDRPEHEGGNGKEGQQHHPPRLRQKPRVESLGAGSLRRHPDERGEH